MGTISVINTNRLYWLGRYSERVYTTLRIFCMSFEKLIEQFTEDYSEICRTLDIPNIYADKDDFIGRYAFSDEDPNSIISNLIRAYDNAIELRDEIGSETLAYIQLALYSMRKAERTQNPVIEFQYVIDDILAFWGIVDDQIDDEDIRNIIKVGKRVERLDLYARLKMGSAEIEREINRLISRLAKSPLSYNHDRLEELMDLMVEGEEPDYQKIILAAEQLVEA